MSYKWETKFDYEEALNPNNKFVLRDGVIEIVYGSLIAQPLILSQVENSAADYLNHNLMKIERDSFYATNRYTMTYEELPTEL